MSPDVPEPGSGQPFPAGPAAPRLLRRSRDDRIIAGVCGGVGRYLGVDPVLCRIAFVVLVIGAGTGILLYLLAWLVIPLEQPGDHVGPRPPAGQMSGQVLVGLIFIALGAVLLARILFPELFGYRYLWPAMLIVVGALIILRGARR